MLFALRSTALAIAALTCALIATTPHATADDEVTVRYSVEVTLEVDGKRGTGRGVLESRFWFQRSANSSYLAAGVTGDAIPIEIEGVGTVFALQRWSDRPSETAAGAWILYCMPRGLPELDLKAISTFPSCDAAKIREPMLAVNRGTEAEPKLEFVRYTAQGGPAELIGVKVAVTDEPMTRGMATVHPWIAGLPTIFLSDGSGTTATADYIYREDFSR